MPVTTSPSPLASSACSTVSTLTPSASSVPKTISAGAWDRARRDRPFPPARPAPVPWAHEDAREIARRSGVARVGPLLRAERVAGRRQIACYRDHQAALEGLPGGAGRERPFEIGRPAAMERGMQRIRVAEPRQQTAIGAPFGIPLVRAGRDRADRRTTAVGRHQGQVHEIEARLHGKRQPATVGRPGDRPGPVAVAVVLAGRQHFDVASVGRLEHPHGGPVRHIGDVASIGRVDRHQGVACPRCQPLFRRGGCSGRSSSRPGRRCSIRRGPNGRRARRRRRCAAHRARTRGRAPRRSYGAGA